MYKLFNMKKLYTAGLFLLYVTILRAQAPTNGLIAKYSFKTSSTLLADNHNGTHTLSNTGTVTNVSGYIDSAASFSGNNRLSVAHSDFNPGSMSLAAWFKVTGPTQYATIAVVRYNTNATPFNSFNVCTGSYVQNHVSLFFSTSSNSDVSVTSTTVVSPDTWYHVIATYDELTGIARIYINGSLEGSLTLANPETLIYSDDMFTIGHVPNGTSSAAGNGFVGSIDEVLVYNRALLPGEVASVYGGTIVTTSINESGQVEKLKIYPNPVRDILTLETRQAQDLTLLDQTGSVLGYFPSARTVDVKSLPAGIYLLRNSHGQNFKFIKSE